MACRCIRGYKKTPKPCLSQWFTLSHPKDREAQSGSPDHFQTHSPRGKTRGEVLTVGCDQSYNFFNSSCKAR